APSFVAVEKSTGKVVWQDSSPGNQIMEGQWGSPAAARVSDRWQVIFPGGDGWLYAFNAPTGQLLWKFDCNPKGVGPYLPGGRGDRSFLMATPVVSKGKLYIGVGQNPEDGDGVGHLWCIDLARATSMGRTNAGRNVSLGEGFLYPKAMVNQESALV